MGTLTGKTAVVTGSTSGVQTYPGLMQLQVILKVASSSATVLVSPAMPCLAET